MFGLKGMFKSAKKVQNKDTLEAVVAGCMLIAAADGTVEKPEMEKMINLLSTDPNLSAFKPAEIRIIAGKYQTRLEADFMVGQKQMLKEISDISDDSDKCEEVFLNMVAISKADGEVEPEEKAVLLKVAGLLSLSPKEYGIE